MSPASGRAAGARRRRRRRCRRRPPLMSSRAPAVPIPLKICGNATRATPPSARHVAGANHLGARVPGELGSGRRERAAPDDREDRRSPARMEHEQDDRRVRAGDQRVDHRVVDPAQPQLRLGLPVDAVEEHADAEHPGDARGERDCRGAGNRALRRDGERHAGGERDDERDLMRHASQARRVGDRLADQYCECERRTNPSPPSGRTLRAATMSGRPNRSVRGLEGVPPRRAAGPESGELVQREPRW